MANGIMLGGFAEGSEASTRLGQTQQQIGLRERGVELAEKQATRQEDIDLRQRANENFNELAGQMQQALQAAAILKNKNPEAAAKFEELAKSLVPKLEFLAPTTGRDPQIVQALVLQAQNASQIQAQQAQAGAVGEAGSLVAGIEAKLGRKLTADEREQVAGLEPPGTTKLGQGDVLVNEDTGKVIGRGDPKSTDGALDLTVEQGKATTFAGRMNSANIVLDELETEFTGFTDRGAVFAPNGLKGAPRQKFENAKTTFLRAILRKDSGAVISSEEINDEGPIYLPEPGDGEEVLAQKKRNRLIALEGVKLESGGGFEALQKKLPPVSKAAKDSILKPKTQADFDKMPSGTFYIDPKSGKTYRKQ